MHETKWIAGALICAGMMAPAIQVQAAGIFMTVPVVQVRTGYGGQHETYPRVRSMDVELPHAWGRAYRDQVSLYQFAGSFVLAPRGWVGEAGVGADGTIGLSLYNPRNRHDTLTADWIVGSAQMTAEQDIVKYFPGMRKYINTSPFTPRPITEEGFVRIVKSNRAEYFSKRISGWPVRWIYGFMRWDPPSVAKYGYGEVRENFSYSGPASPLIDFCTAVFAYNSKNYLAANTVW